MFPKITLPKIKIKEKTTNSLINKSNIINQNEIHKKKWILSLNEFPIKNVKNLGKDKRIYHKISLIISYFSNTKINKSIQLTIIFTWK